MSTAAAEDERIITNVVFMGMGEPLANYRSIVPAAEILMAERTARVVAGTDILDLAEFRAPGLEGDLRGRDFTVNGLFYDPVVDSPPPLFFPLFLCLLLTAASSLRRSSQYLLQKFGAKGGFVQDRSGGFRDLRGCKD